MTQTIIIDGNERVLDLSSSWDRMLAKVNEIQGREREFNTPVRSIENSLSLNYELAKLIFKNEPDNLFSLRGNYDRRETGFSFEDILKPYMVEGTFFVMPKPQGIVLEKVGTVFSEGYTNNNDLYQNWIDGMLKINPDYLSQGGPDSGWVKKSDFEGYRTKDLGHILLNKNGKNLFLPKKGTQTCYEDKRIWNSLNVSIWTNGAYILTSKKLIDVVNQVYSEVEQNYEEHGDRITLELI
ncbi:hypothetical protein HN385_02680 [archaeon]|jgi:hypothetical protein|nr:hypothetical protein [archaeon]MBT3450656.1 hypothetical protein [archaeon]MBT6868764.1 hypothetical protein [archaeon]MBT7193015.1 hypothetical protein [archaeon]MBT7380981.1 hypothetical protein [archaeon]